MLGDLINRSSLANASPLPKRSTEFSHTQIVTSVEIMRDMFVALQVIFTKDTTQQDIQA